MAVAVLGEAIKVARRIRDRVSVVYDIGARVGEWSNVYRTVFPEARFHLFEANDKGRRFDDSRWTWHHGVLAGPGVKSVEFYRHPGKGDGGDSYYKDTGRGWRNVSPKTMPARTLDSMGLPPPQVIKLDTQGSELDILDGGTEALKTALMVQMEMPIQTANTGAPTLVEYVDLMLAHGFGVQALEEVRYGMRGLFQVDLIFVPLQEITLVDFHRKHMVDREDAELRCKPM